MTELTDELVAEGLETAQAASMAIIHGRFQVTEALSVRQHGTGQVVFTAATKLGADALKQMPYVELGIQEQFSAWLFPDVTQATISDTAKSLDAAMGRASGSGAASSTSELPITKPPQASTITGDPSQLPMHANLAFDHDGKLPNEFADMES